MPKASRGGTETFWRVWGDPPPELLMIHCSLAHSGALTGLALELGRPAVAFDMPGHGKSDPHDFETDLHSEVTQVAADFLSDPPMDVIGHSFGATVALRLALEQPKAVRRLVLIEPILFAAIKGSPIYDQHVATFQPFVDAMMAGDAMYAAKLFTSMWGTGVEWEHMRADQRETLASQILLIPEQNDLVFEDNAGLLTAGRLEEMQIPTLLVQGEQTAPIVGAVQAALAARISNADAITIEGVGHMAPITHPAKMAGVIKRFLSD